MILYPGKIKTVDQLKKQRTSQKKFTAIFKMLLKIFNLEK